MLRGELLDILNSGTAWALVGSGPSVDSGYPSWERLIARILSELDDSSRKVIEADSIYSKSFTSENFARCFSRIEEHIGRPKLEALLRSQMVQPRPPGELVKLIVDLPFAAYLTTNYDDLLERALSSSGQRGWISVGNSANEVRKVSGAASQVVWHVHGCATMPNTESSLVLSEKDYDDLYLNESQAIHQLKGLLTNHRIVVIGFGFRDPEVMRILKRVGRLSNPARPIYAFVGGLGGAEHGAEREELLRQYNVDVIPYETKSTHRQLQELLGVYGALVLRRSLKFNYPARPCPSYDPETTGLLVYNEFCLRGGASVSENLLGALLRARIVSVLKYRPRTEQELVHDLAERARLIKRDRSRAEISGAIGEVLRELGASGLIRDGASQTMELTQAGIDAVAHQSATAERLSSQFTASLKSRSVATYPNSAEGASRIAVAAESFLKECIEKKALGVAMTRFASRTEEHSFHMVALLQGLPRYMSQLKLQEEAIALSQVVQGVFSAPTLIESRFIGLALQAQFGVHLLGYDQPTLQARTKDLTDTFFLIDSSTLIQFLARSSRAYDSAHLLLRGLGKANCLIGTTHLLIGEVAEHARYAASTADPKTGRPTTKTLEAATGRAGEWVNAFIEGFLEEVNKGGTSDLHSYLNARLESGRADGLYTDREIEGVLQNNKIVAYQFDRFHGFRERLYDERDSVQAKIAEHREKRGTYKHARQVKAEAEALIIIHNLRNKSFAIDDHPVSNAYFVSHTRIIDEVAEPGVPITLRPESALQWITTIRPCPIEELSALANSLWWELSERDLTIIDESKLKTTFSPLIDSSKEKLGEELDRHRALIATMYGEDGHKAFENARGLEVPTVLESLYAQEAKQIERLYEEEKGARIVLQNHTALSEKERRELEVLRIEKKQRELKARSKKRAAKSRKRKGNKRRRH